VCHGDVLAFVSAALVSTALLSTALVKRIKVDLARDALYAIGLPGPGIAPSLSTHGPFPPVEVARALPQLCFWEAALRGGAAGLTEGLVVGELSSDLTSFSSI